MSSKKAAAVAAATAAADKWSKKTATVRSVPLTHMIDVLQQAGVDVNNANIKAVLAAADGSSATPTADVAASLDGLVQVDTSSDNLLFRVRVFDALSLTRL